MTLCTCTRALLYYFSYWSTHTDWYNIIWFQIMLIQIETQNRWQHSIFFSSFSSHRPLICLRAGIFWSLSGPAIPQIFHMIISEVCSHVILVCLSHSPHHPSNRSPHPCLPYPSSCLFIPPSRSWFCCWNDDHQLVFLLTYPTGFWCV